MQPPAKPQDTRLEGFAWKTLEFSSSLPMANPFRANPFRHQLCMSSLQAGHWWGRKNPPNSSNDARPQANRKAGSNVHPSGETYRGSDFLVSPKPNPNLCSSGRGLSAEKGPRCMQIPRRFWKLVQNWREAGLSIDQRWVSGNCWWVEGQRQVGR